MTNSALDDGSRGPLSSHDEQLVQALRQVPIPDGLEARLLAAVQRRVEAPAVQQSTVGWSRRHWLSLAAGFAGSAVVGGYLYQHRKLSHGEITDGARDALASKDWVLPWQAMETPPGLPLPRQLKSPRGWQYIATPWSKKTAAFDLTLPGGRPAVLFVARVRRDVSHLPAAPVAPAVGSRDWSQIAVWQSAGVLYVLASQGAKHDYDALFVNAGGAGLA